MQKANAAEVEKYLRGLSYPCNLGDIVDHAIEEGAPDAIVAFLERMPEREYEDGDDVTKTLNGV